MPAFSAPTTVTFPSGAVDGDAVVVDIHSATDADVVFVDATPFHPVDHTWPDQPGDSGWVGTDADRVAVSEAVMGAVDESGEIHVGDSIPVKRGAEGWTWLVGHRLEEKVPEWLVPGLPVRLHVDAELRSGLSRGHTACHLASLALDAALADLWRKDVGEDALGNPDFEGRANQTSRIHPDGSVDTYRLGKSLRKAGFDTETFAATLAQREEAINARLADWVASAAPSSIRTDGPTIVDRRTWRCELPGSTAEILCGGTHVDSLDAFSEIRVVLDLSDPQLLVMTTSATAA